MSFYRNSPWPTRGSSSGGTSWSGGYDSATWSDNSWAERSTCKKCFCDCACRQTSGSSGSTTWSRGGAVQGNVQSWQQPLSFAELKQHRRQSRMTLHEANAKVKGMSVDVYTEKLFITGQKSVKDQDSNVTQFQQSVVHLTGKDYPCLVQKNLLHSSMFARKFCKPLEVIADWNIRRRSNDGDSCRLKVTMKIAHDPNPVSIILQMLFSMLSHSPTSTGTYDGLSRTDSDALLLSMSEIHPDVATEVQKMQIQQFEEDSVEPLTPEPPNQYSNWSVGHIEFKCSNTGVDVIVTHKKNPNTNTDGVWTKLPLPCSMDPGCGRVWLVGCPADNTHALLDTCKQHNVGLICSCDTVKAGADRLQTLSTANYGIQSWAWPAIEKQIMVEDWNAIQHIIQMISNHRDVLLCCATGRSSAPIQACKLLMLFYGSGWECAAKMLLKHRPTVNLQRRHLQKFEDELYSLEIIGTQNRCLNLQRRQRYLNVFSRPPS